MVKVATELLKHGVDIRNGIKIDQQFKTETISEIQQQNIDEKQKECDKLNNDYWGTAIPAIRQREAEKGFAPESWHAKAKSIYLKLEKARKELQVLKYGKEKEI